MFAAGSMPKLQKLQITFAADETDFQITVSSCDFGIENLACLDAVRCEVLSWSDETVAAAKSAMERAASAHPNHPTLLFKRSLPWS